jgi:tetratricopeptide (TPR) repeat protein
MSCSQASNRPFCLPSLLYETVRGDGSPVKTKLARWPWLGIACVASVLAGPAAAQTQKELDWCNGKDSAGADLVISGCTAVIQSKGKSPKDLSTAFNNRGNAYYDKKNYDRAIADYSEALRLDPQFALAFYNRSCAYRDKGDNDHAMDDYVQAILLDPSLK